MFALTLCLADVPVPGVPNLLNGPSWFIVAGAVGFLVLLLGLFALRQVLGKSRPRAGLEKDLTIDISRLEAVGPGKALPTLEFRGLPVRLAVLVLAPVGRSGVVPPSDQLGDLVNQIVPELMQVVTAQRPIFRRWPHQLSSQGFMQLFSANLKLPGDRGRNTPWCSVAGKFEANGQQFLAGLVLCAEKPNSYTPVVLQETHEWPSVLGVRTA